jgi:phage gpG-like protein
MPILVSVPSSSVLLKLPGFAPRLHARLVQVTKRLAIMLQRYVKESKLSGQVLNVRTSTLHRSINQRVDEDKVIGYVGTNVPYGRIHEFGFHGTVTVREHLRRTVKGKMALVHQHPRNVDLPVRSFLRSALEDKRSFIIESYEKVAREEFKK